MGVGLGVGGSLAPLALPLHGIHELEGELLARQGQGDLIGAQVGGGLGWGKEDIERKCPSTPATPTRQATRVPTSLPSTCPTPSTARPG